MINRTNLIQQRNEIILILYLMGRIQKKVGSDKKVAFE